ncbi:MAG: UDP-N-acetylmuramoyl-L-alanyl-D-glutamate--2,6-diaminopimelate ligase [Firmicutes bacterium]|nr:UDP-N-acetylmuramoyl-L-alanyl-D-glutamate--2,6-diaminopimelate ligase [Bacillota bacterium]
MKLESILKKIDYSLLSGSLDTLINDIKYDSRKVEKDDIYVALKGFTSDGHDYIPEAISKGASVIVLSKMVSIHGDVTVIKVDDTRIALSYMADNYFGNPSDGLTTIGVTGTTGKTTTTHMIRDMLESVGVKCGLIGSIGIKYNDIVEHTDNTTPESYEVHKAFKKMLDAGMTHVVMECSSQAFKMHRLSGITFDLGVLTNVTTDHIGPGEHESQEEYVACKNMLFLNSKKVISNNDSEYLNDVLKDVKVPIITYALDNEADIKVSKIKLINDSDFFGSEFNTTGLISDTFRTSIPGEFNIYNSLCSLTVINALGIDSSKAKEALLNVKVRGRMETALVTSKFKVLIDYAHTEDGMKELVKTLRAYKPKRLVSIFGGGGNRPKERRYSLGEIIGGSSDLCIITMDNPRFEEISSINKDIKVGLDKVNAKYIEIEDRSEAIKYACMNALDGDLILLVGKGHEEYQDIKGTKYYFNELDVIEEVKVSLK